MPRSVIITDVTDDVHGEGVRVEFMRGSIPMRHFDDASVKFSHLPLLRAWTKGDDETFEKLLARFERDDLRLLATKEKEAVRDAVA